MSSPRTDLVTHSAVYWVGVMLTKATGFVVVPVFTHYLSPHEYGTLELLALTTDVVGMMVGLQLSAALFKFYNESETAAQREGIVSTAILGTAALAIVAAVLLILGARQVSVVVFGTGDNAYLFQVMFAATFLGIVLEMPMSYLRVKEKSRRFVMIETAQVVTMAVLNVFFVAVLGMSVLGALLGSLLVNAVLAPALTVAVLREVGARVDRVALRRMLRYSLPLVPAAFGMFVLHFSDRFLLSKMTTLEMVGIYAIAYKFGFLIANVVMAPFGMIWENRLFIYYRSKERDALYNQVLAWFSAVVMGAVLVLGLFADEAVSLLTAERYWPAAALVPVIAYAYLFNALNILFTGPLYAEKRTGVVGAVTVAGAVINVALNLLLIPRFGVAGAAWATVLSFALIFFAMQYWSRRLAAVRWEWPRVLRVLAVGSALLLAGRSIEYPTLAAALAMKVLLVAAYPALLFVTGFLAREERDALRGWGRKMCAWVAAR